jgi:hypothetical protein
MKFCDNPANEAVALLKLSAGREATLEMRGIPASFQDACD